MLSLPRMTRLILLLLAMAHLGHAQKKEGANKTISGYVRDASNGEALIGVNVTIPSRQVGTSSNAYGFFSLTVPEGSYELLFQYMGYEKEKRSLNLEENTKLEVELRPTSTQLKEVEVSAQRSDANVRSTEMSVAQLDMKEVKKIPALLGEVDVIRSLTLLPGVSTVGEGSGGFNVRGGNTDQNLILLDQAPVYNSSHLFGFFSIFNPDAVKDVKLYKGGIPARYGGRLSSVVDVRQIEGNNREFGAEGGLGLLSSRLMAQGPLKKKKASFMVAGRRSYIDLFLKLSDDPDINQNILYFYDLNAKVNYQIDAKNQIFLSGYYGRDVFGIQDLFNFDWGNLTGSMRWNHLINEQTFVNTTAIFSDYTYSLGTPEEQAFNFRLRSSITDFHLKNQWTQYLSDRSTLRYGLEGIFYRFKPGKVTGSVQSTLQEEYALEPSAYISHEYEFGPLLSIRYGLRYSSFYNLGPRTVYQYDNPDLPTDGNRIDSTQYDGGELIQAYDGLEGLEPRLAVTYLLSDEQSLKASFNRMRQYIHLISNTTSPTPVDIYRPAGKYIQPATVNQVALGYFQNLEQNTWESSLELYYKTFANVVDYRNGADLIFNESIETELLSGEGRSYGLEFLLRKNRGDFTGWISYTFSRTENRIDATDPTVAINSGQWYPANYDKRHDLSLVLSYQLSPKWSISSTFSYQTGRPVTPPEGAYQYENFTVPIYRNRNSLRTPDYHRLDLSASYSPARDTSKSWQHSWSFGVYNLYARRNPYSVYFEQQDGGGRSGFATQAMRLSIFATAIPFVTWNFNF